MYCYVIPFISNTSLITGGKSPGGPDNPVIMPHQDPIVPGPDPQNPGNPDDPGKPGGGGGKEQMAIISMN